MEGFRRFCNKVYQATKFVLKKIEGGFIPHELLVKEGTETLPERWIIHKLNAAAYDIHRALEERGFSRALPYFYEYWYGCLCDVFIESSKTLLQEGESRRERTDNEYLVFSARGGPQA